MQEFAFCLSLIVTICNATIRCKTVIKPPHWFPYLKH